MFYEYDALLEMIDPETALKILPTKIDTIKRQITETAQDIIILDEVEGHDKDEKQSMHNRLRFLNGSLLAYQTRLINVENALKPPAPAPHEE